MLNFCLQSLLREYGWEFLWRVVLPHPVRAARAFIGSSRLDCSGELITTPGAGLEKIVGEARSIVGVGFCLKPTEPPCLSGRFNHDCHYLELLLQGGNVEVPDCCRDCAVRRIGLMSLNAGSAFYIMTSAHDILHDLFLPALDEQGFTAGLFVLCRYSVKPFAVGLMASDIRGRMIPLERGDCRDYSTWLRADRGSKDEQTCMSRQNHERLAELLGGVTGIPEPGGRCTRQGNILYPP